MSDAGGNIERVSSDFAPLVTETLPMPVLPLDDTRAYGLVYGEKYVLQYSRNRGNDAFFVSRGVSRKKTIETFPLTLTGWRQAFAAFEQLEPKAAARYLQRVPGELHSEEWRRRLAGGIGFMRSCIYLGGHGVSLTPGEAYDLLFEQDALLVIRRMATVAEIPYSTVHRIEISGRGEVTSGGGFRWRVRTRRSRNRNGDCWAAQRRHNPHEDGDGPTA